jgi:MtaA/CmuA family methyltransferase
MARPTVRRDLQTSVELGVPAAPLIFPIFEPVAARQAGVSYHAYATQAAAMSRVWDVAVEQFDVDWAGFFVDDLFEYEPLGIEIADGPDHPYAVTRYLPAETAAVNRLRLPNFNTAGRLPVLLEALQRVRDRWGSSLIVGKSVAAPFSGLTLLCGLVPIMEMVRDDPDWLRARMPFMEELAIGVSLALIEAGADLIWLGECSASSRFLSLEDYRALAFEPARRVTAAIRQTGATVIYHAGENRLPYLEATAELGADVLSVESGVDLAEVKRAVGRRVCLSGNLDGLHLVWNAEPAAIEREARRLSAEVGSQGGVIVNTGEGIPEATPLDNLRAMFRGIREGWPRRPPSDEAAGVRSAPRRGIAE